MSLSKKAGNNILKKFFKIINGEGEAVRWFSQTKEIDSEQAAGREGKEEAIKAKKAVKMSSPITKEDLYNHLQVFKRELTSLKQELMNSWEAILDNKLDILQQRLEVLETGEKEHKERTEQLEFNLSTTQRKVETNSNTFQYLYNEMKRNNIRIRLCGTEGIAERKKEETEEKKMLFKKWLWEIIPECEEELKDMDRMYFDGNPRRNYPRDIVITFSKYSSKDKIMKELRKMGQVKYKGKNVMFLQDLAPETLQKRRELKEYSERLREENIQYFWGFPFKMTIIYKGNTHVITNKEEIKSLFQKLGLGLQGKIRVQQDDREEEEVEVEEVIETTSKYAAKKTKQKNTAKELYTAKEP